MSSSASSVVFHFLSLDLFRGTRLKIPGGIRWTKPRAKKKFLPAHINFAREARTRGVVQTYMRINEKVTHLLDAEGLNFAWATMCKGVSNYTAATGPLRNS